MNPRSLTALAALALACCRRDEHVLPTYPPDAPPAAASSVASASAGAAASVPVPDGAGGPCTHTGSGRDLRVGPGQRFENIGDAPFETLAAGDTVRIFWRQQPYREKMMVSGMGTADQPVRVCGVPGPDGQLPVIDGQDATTRASLDFPFDGHQVRGVVIVGHRHGEPWENTPSYIVIEGLEVRNGAKPNTFTDRSGKKAAYTSPAAGIFVERANHLVIRGCTITENNNGLFVGTGGDETTVTRNVLIEKNYIYGNGSLTDYYEHNVYNDAAGVVYQYNRFGPPRAGSRGVLGANIKERSAGVVIRYNWIEDGAHVLDIVDAQESKDVTRPMPSFHSTYVYGNVIIRGATPSGTLIHYGGDSGAFDNYRKGTLFFYDNTVVVENGSYPAYTHTAVFELSTGEEHLDSRNNVYSSAVAPDALHPVGMLGGRDRMISGVATFAGDWVRKGWTANDLTAGSMVDVKAEVHGLEKATRGDGPGFRDAAAGDYALVGAGPALSAGTAVTLRPDVPLELLPTAQYVKHQQGKARADSPTPGAFGE